MKEIDNIEKDTRGFSALMRLIRPKQWIKNGFVFVPLFFGGELFNTEALLAGLMTFFAYRFAATVGWRQDSDRQRLDTEEERQSQGCFPTPSR